MSAAQNIQNHPMYQQASQKAQYYHSQLDKELGKYPILNNIEQRTQVPKTFLVIGAAVLMSLLIFINALASPVSNLVGWALPAYLSFKAIESPAHEDDIQWLTYWVVFGFFNFLESFALRAVLYYFPFYYAFKTIFVLWLQLPATKGARTFYVNVLRPIMAQGAKSTKGSYSAPETATADDLRAKVHTATEY
ncbi:Protein YOP1 [Serendipita indica DSM 11827]|uniref:Protein YOP1 n=1 Tax=Serendipita indica (strain DSM 11827) TaxID=1109443 RepID=G4U2P3_SERID|nr:Protein YOP1 [Serendipita indica DSM 11827]CCA77867.1 related to YOP1-Ypt-interacting protein [Serendipita indica DSM 11827]